jgi:hypothetical protein
MHARPAKPVVSPAVASREGGYSLPRGYLRSVPMPNRMGGLRDCHIAVRTHPASAMAPAMPAHRLGEEPRQCGRRTCRGKEGWQGVQRSSQPHSLPPRRMVPAIQDDSTVRTLQRCLAGNGLTRQNFIQYSTTLSQHIADKPQLGKRRWITTFADNAHRHLRTPFPVLDLSY